MPLQLFRAGCWRTAACATALATSSQANPTDDRARSNAVRTAVGVGVGVGVRVGVAGIGTVIAQAVSGATRSAAKDTGDSGAPWWLVGLLGVRVLARRWCVDPR